VPPQQVTAAGLEQQVRALLAQAGPREAPPAALAEAS
jgi:hypothetical protein